MRKLGVKKEKEEEEFVDDLSQDTEEIERNLMGDF